MYIGVCENKWNQNMYDSLRWVVHWLAKKGASAFAHPSTRSKTEPTYNTITFQKDTTNGK